MPLSKRAEATPGEGPKIWVGSPVKTGEAAAILDGMHLSSPSLCPKPDHIPEEEGEAARPGRLLSLQGESLPLSQPPGDAEEGAAPPPLAPPAPLDHLRPGLPPPSGGSARLPAGRGRVALTAASESLPPPPAGQVSAASPPGPSAAPLLPRRRLPNRCCPGGGGQGGPTQRFPAST